MYVRNENDLKNSVKGNIALLRLDTDFYESTKKELEVLFPRLQPNGVLIVDDYGVISGSTFFFSCVFIFFVFLCGVFLDSLCFDIFKKEPRFSKYVYFHIICYKHNNQINF